jgi:hypothetical protein
LEGKLVLEEGREGGKGNVITEHRNLRENTLNVGNLSDGNFANANAPATVLRKEFGKSFSSVHGGKRAPPPKPEPG